MLVAGSAGLGVTRFLDEAFERAVASPEAPLLLRGRAHGPVDPPWAAVLEALGPLLADRPSEELIALLRRDAGPVLRQVPALAPLARGLAVPRTSALADPERRQPRALEALLRWLGRRAAERPIVLALEDLHVADAATRAFATFVARIAREERIALVLSYQPDRLTREHPLRENLAIIDAGLRPPVRVDLAPFTRGEIASLIEGIEGERPSASIVVLVSERSAGSPWSSRSWSRPAASSAARSLTGTLSDIVAARLARRSPECRRLLRLLAPAERPSAPRSSRSPPPPSRPTAAATRLPPRSAPGPRRGTDELDADLAAGLEEAMEHGFVRRDAGRPARDPPRARRARRRRRPAALAATPLPGGARPGVRRDARPSPPRSGAAPTGSTRRGPPRSRPAGSPCAWRRRRTRSRSSSAASTCRRPAAPAAPGDDAGPDARRARPAVELAQLAAEAAYAAVRPTRAVAYAESALAGARRANRPPAPRGPRGAARPVPDGGRRRRRAPLRRSGARRTWRPGADRRARPDPRAARPGADDRRRVPGRRAGRRRGARGPGRSAATRSPRRSTP